MTASGMAPDHSTLGSAGRFSENASNARIALKRGSRGPAGPESGSALAVAMHVQPHGQPLQPLSLVTEPAPRIKAASVLQVVPGDEMATGSPGAKRFVSGVGGDEGGCLERRAGIEVIGERARINTAVGVLVKQSHNRPFAL